MPMEVKTNSSDNLVFKISTSVLDRDGDILEPKGVMLENYRNNSVVLFAHNYSNLPIGKSISEKIYQDCIESEVEFAPTAFAQDCKKLCEKGFLNAASVGFIGHESEQIEGSKYGKRYTKWELLEWSIVPVPSNFGSLLQNAKAKGINLDAMEKELKIFEENFEEVKTVITKPGWDETETSFRFRVRDPGLFQEGSFRTVPIKKDKPRVNSVMGRLKDETTLTVQSVIFPKEDDWDLAGAKTWLKEHEDLTKGDDEMIEKAVIPYKKYPLADEGATWDGPKEIAAASVDDLKLMCTWYDSENSENKGAYKLPHHTQSGKMTVWRAVAASMAALLGARGGVSIPDSDRKGVYNHLAKHYADFEKEVPEFKKYTDIELKTLFPEDTKSFSPETKKPDLQGNPSVWDIMDAIRLATNPAEIYNRNSPYIDDLYPTRYPSGSVVIEKMEKCYLYQYEYKDGVAILSADFMELEEVYKPKGFFQKSGATLSSKTKKMLDEIHANINGCNGRLRKFIDSSGIAEDEPPDPGKSSLDATIKILDIPEVKQALEEIKSQVLLLCPKDANKDINLDAIEFPKAEKHAAHNELGIKPEELKQLITEIINNQIKGGS